MEGTVPADLKEGDIRVVVEAESKSGDPVVVAYGVTVVERQSSSGSSWPTVLFVVLGLALVGGFVIPAAKRRKQKQ